MNKLKFYVISVIGISAGILCFGFTVYALFEKNITSGQNQIKTTGFCVEVTIEQSSREISGNDAVPDDVSGNEMVYEGIGESDTAYKEVSENRIVYESVSENDAIDHDVSKEDVVYGSVSENDATYNGIREDNITLSTELAAGTYEIMLTRQAGGAAGFCLLFLEEGENKITCFTQQIPDRIAFTLILQEETFLTVMPHWGRPDAYGYHESDETDAPQNIYITEGKTVEISSVETGTEH